MKFSTTVTKQPRKKRKELYTAELHTMRKLVNIHLSKELREKFKQRSMLVRKGDKVKILKGKFAGLSGKVASVDVSNSSIRVEGAVAKKQGGKEVLVPIVPAATVIIEAERKTETK